jgi:hypothetical protein
VWPRHTLLKDDNVENISPDMLCILDSFLRLLLLRFNDSNFEVYFYFKGVDLRGLGDLCAYFLVI